MNPSKLQSEAVIKFDKRFNCNDDWDSSLFELTPVGYVNANKKVKQFLSDQIQKAYSNGREEENFVNDLLLECWFQFAYETGNNELWAGGLSTLEHLYDYLKSKGIIDGKGRHIILSIQSKGK